MSREEIFAPEIEIPPEITIECYQFDRWWKCNLKSETLEYEKGIVPKGCPVVVYYGLNESLKDKADFICKWLADRGWQFEGPPGG